MRRYPLILAAPAALILAIVAYPVYAHCGKCASSCKAMLKAMTEGQVTLTSAIASAEKEAKGKAVGAMAHEDKDGVGIDVYVLGESDKLMLVQLDGKTGKVKKTSEAKGLNFASGEGHDHDHDHDKEKKADKPKERG